jgi:3-deoxy-D-manno-octulosonate 8-phosphate phosphatase KdsC-like HAD superfamily phosphatase
MMRKLMIAGMPILVLATLSTPTLAQGNRDKMQAMKSWMECAAKVRKENAGVGAADVNKMVLERCGLRPS